MRVIFCFAAALAGPTYANDGFGGLTATGLTFDQTDAVEMVEENLYIGIDKITVDYVFRNTTDQDVTGEVIFPLPPVNPATARESDMNLPEDLTSPDLVNFTATVDGQPVTVGIDTIAVIEPSPEETRPPSEQYDTPGRDVTAELVRFGVPLTLDFGALRKTLIAAPPEVRAEMVAAGLAEFDDSPEAYGKWSIVTRYHWTQTFPAGKEIRISHSYTNRPPGGMFTWSDPSASYEAALVDQYCIDQGTSAAISEALNKPEHGGLGMAYDISYVLRTANSWAGPIGKFILTIDKGDPKNVVSLCAEGLKQTGPTTFVVEKKNFVPTKDLEILIVKPGTF